MIAKAVTKQRESICNFVTVTPEEAKRIIEVFRGAADQRHDELESILDSRVSLVERNDEFESLRKELRIMCLLVSGLSVGAVANKLSVHPMRVIRLSRQVAGRGPECVLERLREDGAKVPREQFADFVADRLGWKRPGRPDERRLLTPEQIAIATEMQAQGESYRAIADALDVPQTTIYGALNRPKIEAQRAPADVPEHLDRCRGCGAKALCDDNRDCRICRQRSAVA